MKSGKQFIIRNTPLPYLHNGRWSYYYSGV